VSTTVWTPDRDTCAIGAVPVNIGGGNFEVFNRIISLSGAPRSIDESQGISSSRR
jgi:hypothetical protein